MGLRQQLRRLPAIAWRDDRLAVLRDTEKRLRGQVRDLEREVRQVRERNDDRDREIARLVTSEASLRRSHARQTVTKYVPTEPSWHTRIMEQARVGRLVSRLDPRTEYPRRRLLGKLHNYELARSHGVATPRVIGSWSRIAEIPWTELPERFVVKSNRGYSGRGVLPLRRQGAAFALLDSGRAMSPEEIIGHYGGARGVGAPYFVEEVLPGTEVVLPDDVKIYSFYGEIAHILLRRVSEHGDISAASYRFVDAEGEDLGQVQERDRHDPDIAVPRDLAHMVEVARVLSAAVPVPFVRVDLYQVPEGVILGELTPLPGSSESFTQAHDRLLGGLYDQAEARLNLDLSRGRPFAVTFGAHERDLMTPMRATTALPG